MAKTLRCFYCGRPVPIVYDEERKGYIARCRYPRCKLQPETDYEPDEILVEIDWNMIKESLRGGK